MKWSEKPRHLRPVYIRKGEFVTCGSGHLIAVALKDVLRGDIIESDAYSWIGIPKPQLGDAIGRCPCGGHFIFLSDCEPDIKALCVNGEIRP